MPEEPDLSDLRKLAKVAGFGGKESDSEVIKTDDSFETEDGKLDLNALRDLVQGNKKKK